MLSMGTVPSIVSSSTMREGSMRLLPCWMCWSVAIQQQQCCREVHRCLLLPDSTVMPASARLVPYLDDQESDTVAQRLTMMRSNKTCLNV